MLSDRNGVEGVETSAVASNLEASLKLTEGKERVAARTS